MARKIALALMLLAAPALGGCAAQAAMAAKALADEYIPNPEPLHASLAHLEPAARDACTRQAAPHGSVFILDVEQRRADRLVVWGSVTDAAQHRRTFECHFTTAAKVSGFKLREIGAP